DYSSQWIDLFLRDVDPAQTQREVVRRACPAARFVARDVRGLGAMGESFDGVVCLWQSFGYLDESANDRLLADISFVLSPRGRLILDIYNRDFFESRQGTCAREHRGRTFRETKLIDGRRLRIRLDYGDERSGADEFDWQIFTENQITERTRKF